MATIAEMLDSRELEELHERYPHALLAVPDDVYATFELVKALSDSQWGVGGGDAIAEVLQEERPIYNMHCPNGHVYTAPRGSMLERRCIARENQGHPEPLFLDPTECVVCKEEAAIRNKRNEIDRLWSDPEL